MQVARKVLSCVQNGHNTVVDNLKCEAVRIKTQI